MDFSKIQKGKPGKLKPLDPEAITEAIVKVNVSDYVPKNVTVRARIDQFMFTAEMATKEIENLQKDGKIVSVEASKKIGFIEPMPEKPPEQDRASLLVYFPGGKDGDYEALKQLLEGRFHAESTFKDQKPSASEVPVVGSFKILVDPGNTVAFVESIFEFRGQEEKSNRGKLTFVVEANGKKIEITPKHCDSKEIGALIGSALKTEG